MTPSSMPHKIQVRISSEMRTLLDRLREERGINVSAWARLILSRALQAELRHGQTPPTERDAPRPC